MSRRYTPMPDAVWQLSRKKARLTNAIRFLQGVLADYPDSQNETCMKIVDVIILLKIRREKLDQP